MLIGVTSSVMPWACSPGCHCRTGGYRNRSRAASRPPTSRLPPCYRGLNHRVARMARAPLRTVTTGRRAARDMRRSAGVSAGLSTAAAPIRSGRYARRLLREPHPQVRVAGANTVCLGMTRLDRSVRYGRGDPPGRALADVSWRTTAAGRMMAGFSVTVCLPATAATDVMAALGAALAPFGGSKRAPQCVSTASTVSPPCR